MAERKRKQSENLNKMIEKRMSDIKASKRPTPHQLGYPKPEKFDVKTEIQPRLFVYNYDFIKGFVTGTGGAGGSSKTSLLDVEVISMALGRDLMSSNKLLRAGAQKVLVLSLEDDKTEAARRRKAICDHYQLTDEDTKKIKENIFTLFDDNDKLKIVHEVEKKLIKNIDTFNYICNLIFDFKIDVVTIDPLISFHEAEENLNREMQTVLAALREIARTKNVAIHFLHHNRKGGGDSADDIRGAAALKDGARSLRILNKITKKEAKELNIPEDDQNRLVGISSGKSNFSALAFDKKWFKMVSVCLHNGTEHYAADNIGVAVPYKQPGIFDGISREQCYSAWKTIKDLPENKMRQSFQSPEWLGHHIDEDLGLDSNDDKQRIELILKSWEKSGVIRQIKIKDTAKGKELPHYKFERMPDKDDDMVIF